MLFVYYSAAEKDISTEMQVKFFIRLAFTCPSSKITEAYHSSAGIENKMGFIFGDYIAEDYLDDIIVAYVAASHFYAEESGARSIVEMIELQCSEMKLCL